MNPARQPHRRILIVDDAGETRAILSIALGAIAGASVDATDNAEDALQYMTQIQADILITDVRMRGMSGLDLLRELRERQCWPSCGAVVMSGETDPNLPGRALACGADLFFSKPFSAGEVRRSVISLLEGRDGAH